MNLPRKRVILTWHRWMGLFSALFLVVLSITGLVLNHTERLGLDDIQIRNSWILGRYGMESGDNIRSYRIQDTGTLSHIADSLFYNGERIAQANEPVGYLETESILTIATGDTLIYLTQNGELIETVSTATLPFEGITALGSNNGAPVLATEDGLYTTDSNWIEFSPYEGSYTVASLEAVELEAAQKAALLESFQGGGVSLYRVLLDLHAGRLFGWGGRTLMDLTAIAILLLVTSGIGGWLRKSRRHTNTQTT